MFESLIVLHGFPQCDSVIVNKKNIDKLIKINHCDLKWKCKIIDNLIEKSTVQFKKIAKNH